MTCKSCNAEIDDNSKFCTECGSSVLYSNQTEKYIDEKYNEKSLPLKIDSFSLFSPAGCVSRKTYWAIQVAFISVPFLIGLVLALTVPAILSTGFKFDFPSIVKEKLVFLVIIPGLLWLWVNIATSIKRLRDANFSAWLYWLNIIPYLGAFIILILNGFFPSVEQGNKYCKSKNNLSSKAIKWIYIIFLIPIVLIVMAIVVPKFMSSNESSHKESSYESANNIEHTQQNNTYYTQSATEQKQDGSFEAKMTKINVQSEDAFYDTATGLMWQDNNDAKTVQKDWNGAQEYCKSLSLYGYSDWYLPSRKQLNDLLYREQTQLRNFTSNYYWSSTTDAYDTSIAWVHNYGGTYYYDKTDSYYVRCVRGGQ